MTVKKSITVSICGLPNVGKSTLLNRLVGEKISIVSAKPQTTVDNIKGFVTTKDTQIVFIDNPGIFKATATALQKEIIKKAWSAIDNIDLILFMINGTIGINKDTLKVLEYIKQRNDNIIFIINKADKLSVKNKILIADTINQTSLVKDIFSMSALNGDGVDNVLDYIISQAKPATQELFGEDEITDVSVINLINDFIREKIFIHLEKELPYDSKVNIEKFTESENEVLIEAAIEVKKANHKKIIIGHKGSMLKKIIYLSSIDIEKLLNKKASLRLFIKVAK